MTFLYEKNDQFVVVGESAYEASLFCQMNKLDATLMRFASDERGLRGVRGTTIYVIGRVSFYTQREINVRVDYWECEAIYLSDYRDLL